ncbi:unnamed protein product [Calicophoron daubneyi]|uniref:Cyclic nucleotide-binding domain-containing protein n=1 Tax=Calicophoron daubneyi TaxID=300641 RepID=A0AAV2TUK2_CALDB
METKPRKSIDAVDPQKMARAIERFPSSNLNRSMSNLSLLRIPSRDDRSVSTVSASVVSRLLELRSKFATRTEVIRTQTVQKPEEDVGEDEDECTGTDASKTEENELQLDPHLMGQKEEDKVPWWKRYPDRRLVVRQPYCTACLAPHRKHFVAISDKPLIRIEEPIAEVTEKKAEEKTAEESRSFYLLWLIGVALAVVYNYVSIPLREAFDIYDTLADQFHWYIGNIIADSLYVIDIAVIKPRIEYIDGGIVTTDFNLCAKNYIKSYNFKIDMASLLPLDLFSIFYGREMARFRILRLLKIVDILDSANANKVNYRKTMDAALSCMHHLHAPTEVVDKVRTWFMYNWDQQKTFDENSLFETLPIKLKSDLAISVHFHTLNKVSLFQNCERALIYDMVLKLKPVVFLPMDYICRKGEVGLEMYIVKSGVVEVVGGPNNSIVFVTLKEGSVFGEIRRMLNRDKKKAEEAKKNAEASKKEEEEEDSLHGFELPAQEVVEIIPERPPTPKLMDAVVQALQVTYPENPVVQQFQKRASRASFDVRRPSFRRPSMPPALLSRLASSTKFCTSRPTERTSTQPSTHVSDSEALAVQSVGVAATRTDPPLIVCADDAAEGTEEDSTTERTDSGQDNWVNRLTIERNPIKRFTSYLTKTH